MGVSSTSFQQKWRSGKTTVVRVPAKMEQQLLRIARAWDAIQETPLVSRLQRLVEIEAEALEIRRQSGISKPLEVIFFAELPWSDELELRVVADGFGGARTLVSRGPFDQDYSIEAEAGFPTEVAACEAAERYLEDPATADLVTT